jgi:hypothetical protein
MPVERSDNMDGKNKNIGKQGKLTTASDQPLVSRSNVPGGMKYTEYREYLRYDFFFSCAYCSMSEAEATAIRFTIDHYEPRGARPDLVDEYGNLMWACDECNRRRGDRCPPESGRQAGFRFFRPDEDVHQMHFRPVGIRLEAKSYTGEYTINAVDLNRYSLRRLREIRERLAMCAAYVAHGVQALKDFPIDRIHPNLRGRAFRAIQSAEATATAVEDEIDDLLRQYARSPLIDPDPEAESRAEERVRRLGHIEGLFPGNWRAPRKRRGKR